MLFIFIVCLLELFIFALWSFLLVNWLLFPKPFFFQVLLSPPIVVYSPRVLPVYVYDAHADSGKNVRFVNFLYLFKIYIVYSSLKCIVKVNCELLTLEVPQFLPMNFCYQVFLHSSCYQNCTIWQLILPEIICWQCCISCALCHCIGYWGLGCGCQFENLSTICWCCCISNYTRCGLWLCCLSSMFNTRGLLLYLGITVLNELYRLPFFVCLVFLSWTLLYYTQHGNHGDEFS